MGKYRKRVQIAILMAVLVLGGWTVGRSFVKADPIPQKGDQAPAFTVTGLDGATYRFSDLKGKVVVLNFWGTFCPPCRSEMPALQRQAEEWASSGVVVAGMNLGENPVTVRSFLKQYGIRFPIYMDANDEIRKRYGVRDYPTTFFIRPDGSIYEIRVGEMKEDYIKGVITSMLDSRSK